MSRSSFFQIRNMRKKVSVTSQGKSKTSQEDLALAIVEGDLKRVNEIVEAYVALYRGNGFQLIMRFREGSRGELKNEAYMSLRTSREGLRRAN